MQGQKRLFTFLALGALLPIAAGESVRVNLTDFKSGAGGLIHGAATKTWTGASLAAIGDHNGDGFEDYIFGAFYLHKAVIVMKKNTTYIPTTTDAIVSGESFA